jgi:hypothetical protein
MIIVVNMYSRGTALVMRYDTVITLNIIILLCLGACGSVVVKALCYIPEGCWFDTR